jgi:hypothetical protein
MTIDNVDFGIGFLALRRAPRSLSANIQSAAYG